MKRKNKLAFFTLATMQLTLLAAWHAAETKLVPDSINVVQVPQPIALAGQKTEGLLRKRLEKHFDRMEEEKYLPDQFFLRDPTNQRQWQWAGEMEGSSILALVLNARATGRYIEIEGKIGVRFSRGCKDISYEIY